MIRVVPILFGALFTVATAWSLGMLLFRKLSLVLEAWEERWLAFITGSACLSGIMFVLCATRLAYRGVMLAIGLAVIGYAAYTGAFRFSGKAFPALPNSWRWIFMTSFAAFTWYGFFNALAPEHSGDGMSYHLGEVLSYRSAHGFPLITTDLHANFSQGIELLYFFAFDFGRHSAASLLHYVFLLSLVFMVLAYGRRIGRPEVGVAGALFTYTCPVILRDATTAYIDVALAAILFALFYLLQIWDDSRDPRLLLPIGILAGFSYAVKYNAFVAVPYAAGFVAWRLWGSKKPLARPLLTLFSAAGAMVIPWMLKNWVEVANPLSPFANRIFPNPYVHISLEDAFLRASANYELASRWQIPMEVTVKGGLLAGFVGPLFLLTPLALLALRFRPGRQLLLASLVFGATYFSNIGTRLLIPLVPFISLALALAVASLPSLLLMLVLANLVVTWPGMYLKYCTDGAWRLDSVPIEAALRIMPEDTYLSQDKDYRFARMVSRAVPPGNRIFAIGLGGESYLPREVLTGFQGGANEVMQDILWTPMEESYQPTRVLKFDFPAQALRKVRVVLNAGDRLQQWSISELRIFNGVNELPRDSSWRLTAHPNPWDVQMAFDNSLVTRWRSWEPAAPDMYVEVDLSPPQTISAVTVESSSEAINTRISLQADAGGKWTTLAEHPAVTIRPIQVSLRMDATAELKSRGIDYLFVRPEDPFATDLQRYAAAWGLTFAGEESGAYLFHIR